MSLINKSYNTVIHIDLSQNTAIKLADISKDLLIPFLNHICNYYRHPKAKLANILIHIHTLSYPPN